MSKHDETVTDTGDGGADLVLRGKDVLHNSKMGGERKSNSEIRIINTHARKDFPEHFMSHGFSIYVFLFGDRKKKDERWPGIEMERIK
jgi:hypothetical protein